MRLTALLVVFVPALSVCFAADKPAAPLRVVHVGNSHSHPLRMCTPLAQSVGLAQEHAEINILGAPLQWNWDHGQDNKWPQTLAADKKWDAITLLCWHSRDEEYAAKFAAEAFKGNPKCQVYLYTIWPDGNMDWENPSPQRQESHTEKVAQALTKAFPDAPRPRVIPSSLLIRELGRLADRGELPHVASRFQLFSDGGHLSKYGAYADNVMLLAMLHNPPPLDLPDRIPAVDWSGKIVPGKFQIAIPPETARIIRALAWDILCTYPPSGIQGQLIVAQRSLPPAIMGRPYAAELTTMNARAQVVWGTEGPLPEGLTLETGRLMGTPKKAGRFPLDVHVCDAQSQFTRRLSLLVSEDRPPVIAQGALPSIPLDRYFFHELRAEGGVGRLTWTLADGKLPGGIKLMPHGQLVGTPGRAGEFRFTLSAADSHPDGPRSARKEIAWTIAPASPNALVVPRTDQEIVIDGKLDESFWQFAATIEKKMAGDPQARAQFALAWHDSPDKDKRRRRHALYLAVKVQMAKPTPLDAVELFFDALHNREKVYNADDNHMIIPRKGRLQTLHQYPEWAMHKKFVVVETADGYVLEAMFPPNLLFGRHERATLEAGDVYGFDVGITEGEKNKPARLLWCGSERNAEDTSGFGSIVLVE